MSASILNAGLDPAAERRVRRAEEFIEQHCADEIRIADLAATARTSVRSLQAAFRARRGQTPKATLRERRLTLARRCLLESAPGASVTAIAIDCGFFHLGRFSSEYRRRFGESPSQTLRRERSSPNPSRG